MPAGSRGASRGRGGKSVHGKENLGATTATTYCKWNDEENRLLLSTLKTEQADKQAQSGWKKAVWGVIANAIQATYPDHEPKKDASKSMTHYRDLKDEFNLYEKVRQTSGMGWCNTKKYAITSEDVKVDFLRSFGDKYKRCFERPFRYYDDFWTLCGGILATGEHTFHPGQPLATAPLAARLNDQRPVVDELSRSPSAPQSRAASPSQQLRGVSPDMSEERDTHHEGSEDRAAHSRTTSPARAISPVSPPRAMPPMPPPARQNLPRPGVYMEELQAPVPTRVAKRTRQRANSDSDDDVDDEPRSRTTSNVARRNAEAGSQIANAIDSLASSFNTSASSANPHLKRAMSIVEKGGLLVYDDSDDEEEKSGILALHFARNASVTHAFVLAKSEKARKGMLKRILREETLAEV